MKSYINKIYQLYPWLFSRSVALIPWFAFCSSHGWLGAWRSQMHKWRTWRRAFGILWPNQQRAVGNGELNSVDVSEVVKKFARKARNCKWIIKHFCGPRLESIDTAGDFRWWSWQVNLPHLATPTSRMFEFRKGREHRVKVAKTGMKKHHGMRLGNGATFLGRWYMVWP